MEESLSHIAHTIKEGISAELFLQSDIGRYLTRRLDETERQAELKFREVDPDNSDEVRKAQNDLKVVDMTRRFLIDAIESGKAAQGELEEQG